MLQSCSVRKSPQVESRLKDLNKIHMAMDAPVSYLVQALTTPVDETLQEQKTFQDSPKMLTRPPGVANLMEWGAQVMPSGKHQSKTYAMVYESEKSYVTQVWNRKATAPWLRSFQLYCRHRREASIEHQKKETERLGLQMPISPYMTPVKKSSAGGDKEWTHVSEIDKGNKRSLPVKNDNMEIQPNAEKIAQLQAQIAALQRDLQSETGMTSQSSTEA